ncbi:putative ribonuclease H-like domain-containing protein [Tanacetum coccineum]
MKAPGEFSISDCHAGNPCDYQSDPMASIDSPMIRGIAVEKLYEPMSFCLAEAIGLTTKVSFSEGLPRPGHFLLDVQKTMMQSYLRRRRPAIRASYSTLLLEVLKLNRRAYVISCPLGSVKISLTPDASMLDAPSVNKVHGVRYLSLPHRDTFSRAGKFISAPWSTWLTKYIGFCTLLLSVKRTALMASFAAARTLPDDHSARFSIIMMTARVFGWQLKLWCEAAAVPLFDFSGAASSGLKAYLFDLRSFVHLTVTRVDQLEMEELDLIVATWLCSPLRPNYNRFGEEGKTRKMNYNNKQPARFDRRKVRCYKCLQLGHFARECNVKTVDDKARYSAFKVTEVKTDEPKALVSVDSMVNWSDHVAGKTKYWLGRCMQFLPPSLELICPFPYKSDIEETHRSESYASCDSRPQRPRTKTFHRLLIIKTLPDICSARLWISSASVTVVVSDPAVCRKTGPAVNSAGRPNPTRRVGQAAHLAAAQSNPAGWSKRPAPVSAGRPVSAGWLNPGDPSTDNDIGIVDSGCSRSMTGNKEKLDDFVQVKGGIVKFGGGDGRISGKGTIRTSKLDFENVYYVEELQHFNLFSEIIEIVLQTTHLEVVLLYLVLLYYEVTLPDIFPLRHIFGGVTETFYVLKKFIALIENQLNKKVKGIRCDNGTEFKNAKLIELCGEKGIKRDYSNPRTPQQNGVAERKNRTLIEAARTMLADSKLPTMFWTEAVSTACYVLNRVSITNPHNKTPYELLSGKVPQIGHLKPFGCQVTILNTSDHLGKFEGKADEGYLVGYAPNSKAYRVYSLTNKRVEETMNLRFLEDKPNVQGIGHEWYFDLDYLTDSLGYTRFQTDINAGTQDLDSESKVDEQVIVVPSFPSNTFTGPSSSNGPSVMERNTDYAEELAKLQRQ